MSSDQKTLAAVALLALLGVAVVLGDVFAFALGVYGGLLVSPLAARAVAWCWERAFPEPPDEALERAWRRHPTSRWRP